MAQNSPDPQSRSRAEIVIEVTLAILVCLASMVGNLLVVYVVSRNSRLKSLTKKMARVYCALVWLVSVLLATPPLYGWGKIVYHPLFSVYTFTWKIQYISYIIVIAGGVTSGTTIVTFYSYYKIYKTLKESTQKMKAHGLRNGAVSSDRRRTDVKLLKTSFTVVCVFVMCWGPLVVVILVESAGCHIPREVFTAAIFLMFSSSLVNPIIYGIMNPQFTVAFKRVLSCGRYDNRYENQNCTGKRTRQTNDAGGEVETLSNSVQNNSTKATTSVEDVV